MPFRFIHTADIHLDSPLRSLALRNSDLAALIGDATRRALVGIVDLCLEESVDALLIAGDLYDGDQTSMKTARFLGDQLARLDQAGIAVFIIRGNHDALSRITQELILPPSVRVFGGRADVLGLTAGALEVAVHGLSFARPQAPDSLLPKYRAPVPGAVNIGLMHTSLAGAAGHDVYAPCALGDLHGSGFDYWALGHIHKRTDHSSSVGGTSTVIMPGMPQGRDIGEAGEKTVTLVTVGDDRSVTVEQRPTAIAEFARVAVDLTNVDNWSDAVGQAETALADARESCGAQHLVARVGLSGATPLSWRLRRDADLFATELEQRGERLGQLWIDKVEMAVGQPAHDAPDDGDPLAELAGLMGDGTPDDLRAAVRALVEGVRDDLPPDARGFAGNDAEEFEAYLDQLLAEGGADVLARLATPDGGAL